MIISKVIKKQSFILSLENAFSGQRQVGQIDPPPPSFLSAAFLGLTIFYKGFFQEDRLCGNPPEWTPTSVSTKIDDWFYSGWRVLFSKIL